MWKKNSSVKSFSLSQNYPNPFNPSTVISYELPKASHVELRNFNMIGQEVMKLVDEEKPSGKYEVQLNAGSLSSGVYIYRQKANDFTSAKMMMLVK